MIPDFFRLRYGLGYSSSIAVHAVRLGGERLRGLNQGLGIVGEAVNQLQIGVEGVESRMETAPGAWVEM